MYRAALHPRQEDNSLNNTPEADDILRFQVGLGIHQEQVSEAERLLADLSNPQSSNYGQWLAADQEQIQLVSRWIAESGVERGDMKISLSRDHIIFKATVSQAETLLRTRFVKRGKEEATRIVTDSYHVPKSLSHLVSYVAQAEDLQSHTGGNHHGFHLESRSQEAAPRIMPLQRRQSSNSTAQQVDCHTWATPDCLRHLYGLPKLDPAEPIHANSTFGVYLPSMATWLPEDLDSFFARFQPEIVGQRPQVLQINGGWRQTQYQGSIFNLEANLDHEYAMALSYPHKVINLQVEHMLASFSTSYCASGLDPAYDPIYPNPLPGGYNSSDCGAYSPPAVISISYGRAEAYYPSGYVVRQCTEYLSLALLGVTVVVASGDTGTVDEQGQCRDPVTGELRAGDGHFVPLYPCSCPYVTCLGGTQLAAAPADGNGTGGGGGGGGSGRAWNASDPWFPPETALFVNASSGGTIINSGGGFSEVFTAPQWQAGHTERYLGRKCCREHLAELAGAGYFNRSGRGLPDVSLRANDYLVQTNGVLKRVTGTSAVAPVFGAMVARINNLRLRAGKTTVGFLNPVLYEAGKDALTDVVSGYNFGCGVKEAFRATPGWDPVTGLGTPRFEKLVELFMQLP
ncbi:Tripeptidyl-peptidase SED1 [Rhypophila decipiens]